MTEEPCDFDCGYVGPRDRDFREHVCWEHQGHCAECGATKAPEPWQSLTHKPDCPRLQPGYVYPPLEGSTHE